MRPPAALLAMIACLALGSAPLHAAPGTPDTPESDAVLQLLRDKGLLPTAAQIEASPLAQQVQQVRDAASDLVLSAMNFLGVRYRRGGDSAEAGFDCSGFTRHVFEHSLGLVLPRRADQQAQQAGLRPVPRHELEPGDLVFFNTLRRAFSHVGIYVGDGRFIHAPRSGAEVRIEDMRHAYWARRFNGARRAEVSAAPTPATSDSAMGSGTPQ